MKKFLSLLAVAVLMSFTAGVAFAGDCHLSEKSAAAAEAVETDATTEAATDAAADAKGVACSGDGSCCAAGACAAKQAQAAGKDDAACPCGRNKPKQDG